MQIYTVMGQKFVKKKFDTELKLKCFDGQNSKILKFIDYLR